MIVRAKMITDNETETLMFGDSYKSWNQQFSEYVRTYKPSSLIKVETSKEKWIGWGGLKWCLEQDFQEELNREGCQQNEPDNPKARQYERMIFNRNQIAFNVANKIIQK